MVDAEDEIQMLAGFIRRSGGDASGPSGHCLWTRIFKHALICSSDEARRVVYCSHRDVERLRNRGIAPSIGRAAVVVQSHRYCGGAVGIGRWGVAESSIHSD